METNIKVVWRPTISSMETNIKVVWKPTLKQNGNQQ